MRCSSKLLALFAGLSLTACGGQSTLSEVPMGDGGVPCDPASTDGGICPDGFEDGQDGGVTDDDNTIVVDCCNPANATQETLCERLDSGDVPDEVTIVDSCAEGGSLCENMSAVDTFLCEVERDSKNDEPVDDEPADLADLLGGLLGGDQGGGSSEPDPLGDLLGGLLGGGGDTGGFDLISLLLGGGDTGGFDLGDLFGGGQQGGGGGNTGGQGGGTQQDPPMGVDCDGEPSFFTQLFCG